MERLHILYGTRSGNSRMVAEYMENYCRSAGMEAVCENLSTISAETLTRIKYLALVVSTHGEGDPPATVEEFYEALHDSGFPRLDGMKYGVLALGDSNYRNFCQTGRDIDVRLNELGATRLIDVHLCDLDFEYTAGDWTEKICGVMAAEILGRSMEEIHKTMEINAQGMGGSRQRFRARLEQKRLLTGKGSSKHIIHMVLATGNQRIRHKPGDCLRIFGRNSRPFVDRIIRQLGYHPATFVPYDGEKKLLKELLVHEFELTRINPAVVRKWAEVTGSDLLKELAANEDVLQDYCSDRDVLDLVTDHPSQPAPRQFISILRKLHPRNYSIASGTGSHPGELHLTVKWNRRKRNGRSYYGVCTTYLEELVRVGEPVEFEFSESDAFRFPDDPEVPLLMFATSTGIAPFRSVLYDRQHQGIRGNTWLIFGDRNSASDFLYRDELQQLLKSGVLERMDTVFSRDQDRKIYIQDMIRSRQKEVVEWIDRGAYVYLCGTRNNMGTEIRNTLVSILAEVKGWQAGQAAGYFNKIREEGRYCEDLY